MKYNLNFSALGVFIDLDITNVSKNFYKVLVYLCNATENYIYWLEKEVVQVTIPDCFKPDCRVIIDSTEFVVEQHPEIQQRCQFYSHYKKGYSLKVVIGCNRVERTPSKSKSFGGRPTDSQITVSFGLLDKLEAGDLVLADKDFPQIKTTVDKKGKDILLVSPPLLTDGYFTEEKVEETYNIAKVRTHIERIM